MTAKTVVRQQRPNIAAEIQRRIGRRRLGSNQRTGGKRGATQESNRQHAEILIGQAVGCASRRLSVRGPRRLLAFQFEVHAR